MTTSVAHKMDLFNILKELKNSFSDCRQRKCNFLFWCLSKYFSITYITSYIDREVFFFWWLYFIAFIVGGLDFEQDWAIWCYKTWCFFRWCILRNLQAVTNFFARDRLSPVGNYMFKGNNRNTRTRCEYMFKDNNK